ncbi:MULTISPECIES: golvesin C-terminal-like domain-containing protein [Butyricimonas]|uniref:golvesin C-terminal-like domain-containing protein n=1 Tax=Butyricimonas TaxID=574697 RepID=UPI001D070133|nr:MULTISPECIES: hypothetical protein [Butyricimonas]MCB6974908.1 hypothetical protein [Butyricimonas synergistica]MCG4521650.1 hypothetical protein [Butyricimonas sp. DFI.6.44]
MNIRHVLQIARYEVKLNRRQWIFQLFALLTVTGVIACHIYWQGREAYSNWKMVALPCAMPLVNAYLFSLIQSLFLIIIATEQPYRERRYNAMEPLNTRPWDNQEYQWGKMLGLLASFLMVNVIEVVGSVFLVNLTSVAPVAFGYYLFYMLTLSVPSFVFIYGLGIWLCRWIRFRFVVITLLLGFVGVSFYFLPYYSHGTWDFMASGIPNLFSEFTGHVNLGGYLVQRAVYLLIGFGFFCLSIPFVERIANNGMMTRKYTLLGWSAVFIGCFCAGSLEWKFQVDRWVREGYCESFRRNWDEVTCRVKQNDMVFSQFGGCISVTCDLVIYNPNKERLAACVLFLNPGLQVERVEIAGREIVWEREKQVLVVKHPLEAGDSICMRMEYEGKIDDRYCDLHLSADRYEDTFRGDYFFPTGRRGSFVRDDYLLLTSASMWYPVAYPPVNPLMPMASGRDFTRFSLTVVAPRQKVLLSQGVVSRKGDSLFFCPSKVLSGISLCGGEYKKQSVRFKGVEGVLYSKGGYQLLLDRFPQKMDTRKWETCVDKYYNLPFVLDDMVDTNLSWYEPTNPRLYCFETPVSFYTETRIAQLKQEQAEPGMLFWPERGFGLKLAECLKSEKLDWEWVTGWLGGKSILYGEVEKLNSHPLWGIMQAEKSNGDRPGFMYGVKGLTEESGGRVYSPEYPFIDVVLNDLRKEEKGLSILSDFLNTSNFDGLDYWRGRGMSDFLIDNTLQWGEQRDCFRLKRDDLSDRLTLDVSFDKVKLLLNNIYENLAGEIPFDTVCQQFRTQLGVDLQTVAKEWMASRHEQFYWVRDFVVKAYPVVAVQKAGEMVLPKYNYEVTGKVMNVGKTEGILSVECSDFSGVRLYRNHLLAGEAKEFRIVTDMSPKGIVFGLSSNRPKRKMPSSWIQEGGREEQTLVNEWKEISSRLFEPEADVILVDNEDSGFGLYDAEITWLQRFQKKERVYKSMREVVNSTRWIPVVDAYSYGDSIQSCYCKCSGEGKSTATWCAVLPEKGKYRVMGWVYKKSSVERRPRDIVYNYIVGCKDWSEEVEVNMDIALPKDNQGWVCLGEFDFPGGEVNVVLSDKSTKGRKDVIIVADAMKWIKIN